MPERRSIPAWILERVPEARVRRYARILHRFGRMRTKFFFKVIRVGDPNASELAIPNKFLQRHAHRFSRNVTFEIQNCSRKWHMKICVKYVEKSVLDYGYVKKWVAFAKDNDVEAGDLVIFRLVEFSRFIVYILKANAGEPHNAEDIHAVVNQAQRNSDCNGDDDNDLNEQLDVTRPFQLLSIAGEDPSIMAPAETQCTKCVQAQLRRPCALFVTTVLHAEAVDPTEEVGLDVPARFWQLHGPLLPGDELSLQGSSNFVMRVNIRRSLDALHPEVRLEEGWRAFSAANNLRVGDTLLFSLIAPSFFRVEVLDRYD